MSFISIISTEATYAQQIQHNLTVSSTANPPSLSFRLHSHFSKPVLKPPNSLKESTLLTHPLLRVTHIRPDPKPVLCPAIHRHLPRLLPLPQQRLNIMPSRSGHERIHLRRGNSTRSAGRQDLVIAQQRWMRSERDIYSLVRVGETEGVPTPVAVARGSYTGDAKGPRR